MWNPDVVSWLLWSASLLAPFFVFWCFCRRKTTSLLGKIFQAINCWVVGFVWVGIANSNRQVYFLSENRHRKIGDDEWAALAGWQDALVTWSLVGWIPIALAWMIFSRSTHGDAKSES